MLPLQKLLLAARKEERRMREALEMKAEEVTAREAEIARMKGEEERMGREHHDLKEQLANSHARWEEEDKQISAR